MSKWIILSVGSLFFLNQTWATESQGVDQEALKKTQSLLKDSQQRQKLGAQDSNAAAAMQNAESLAGTTQNAQEIYALAADILGDLLRQANGDPEKVAQLLERVRTHPEEFANGLSPEQKAKLNTLSKKIPEQKMSIH